MADSVLLASSTYWRVKGPEWIRDSYYAWGQTRLHLSLHKTQQGSSYARSEIWHPEEYAWHYVATLAGEQLKMEHLEFLGDGEPYPELKRAFEQDEAELLNKTLMIVGVSPLPKEQL